MFFKCKYIICTIYEKLLYARTIGNVVLDDSCKQQQKQKYKLRTGKLIPFGKLIKSLECSIQRSSMRIKFGANAAGSGKRVICLSHPTNKEEMNSILELEEDMEPQKTIKERVNSCYYPLNYTHYAKRILNMILQQTRGSYAEVTQQTIKK